jgi:hypothetical protein
MSKQKLIIAIRCDCLVGRGTCTWIDETFSDEDLAKVIADEDITTENAAVTWARDYEQAQLEQALNYRCGEDTDPELKAYNSFMRRREIADQLLSNDMPVCQACLGSGEAPQTTWNSIDAMMNRCDHCNGTGRHQ